MVMMIMIMIMIMMVIMIMMMMMMQMIVWMERCIKAQICCNMHGSSSSGGKPTLAPFLDLCICAGHRSRDAVICMDSANLVAFFVSFFTNP